MLFPQESNLARNFGLTREYHVEEAMENWTGFIGDENIQTSADHQGAYDSKKFCAGEIDCTDNPFMVQIKVTNRSKVIEVAVFSQQSLHLLPLGSRLTGFF